jgi:hypothetical protein
MQADLEVWTPPADLFPRSRSGKIRPCPHCQRRHRQMLLGLLAAIVFLAGIVSAFLVRPAPAYSAPARVQTASYVSYGNAALNWAEAHATGHWYGWGGTGPSVYDCSGLVYASMLHTNAHWPSTVRTTYAMIAWLWSHASVIPVSQARRGDLLFFGSGHVEFATIWYHTSFGAHHSGTTVGWSHYDPRYYGPTMAFRV